MYDFLRDMLQLADIVKDISGSIDSVNLGNSLPGLDKIQIAGKTGDGKPFELSLEVGKWERE